MLSPASIDIKTAKNNPDKQKWIFSLKSCTLLLEEEFDEFINTRDKLVVIMFGAGWCGPCKIMSPFCEKMQTEKGGAVIFAKVDVDEAEDIAEECEIECMPTFVIFKEGEKVESMMGANKEQLASLIAKHL